MAAAAAWRTSVEAAKGQTSQGQPVRPTGGGEPSPSQSVRPTEDEAPARVTAGDSASKPQNNALAEQLSPQELRLLDQLKQTDREVRQHELAHQIAGGAYTGGAQFQYEIGPDGQRYAVAGEVSVDYGPVTGDPRATIEKMNVVISAALAPAEPSPTDYQVAARARQYLLMAQLELSQQQTEAANLVGEGGAAANDDDAAESSLRDLRVEEYSRIAATTGTGSESAQASLRSVA
ncbi:MAG: SprA-related family protein [Halochromatium sp.]|nr:SprA-related family protein [Halochromatium sp.]